MKSYNVKLLILVAILAVGISVWNNLVSLNLRVPSLWFVLGFYTLSGFLVHYVLSVKPKTPSHFVRQFMGVTVAKLFVYMAVAVVYALFNRDQATGFLLSFLIFYFIFTPFEVYFLTKQGNNKQNQ